MCKKDIVKIPMKTRVGTSIHMDDDENTFAQVRQRTIYLCILEASESGRNGGRGVWRRRSSQGKKERTRATVLQRASPGEKNLRDVAARRSKGLTIHRSK